MPQEVAMTEPLDLLDESELLLELVRHIVLYPEQVEVSVRTEPATELDPPTLVFTILVADADRGRVIGKDRRTLDAIEHLFAKSASMDNQKAVVRLGGRDLRNRNRPRRPQARTCS
jgi:predicted RNA-binding protein YlqC (UPF0109 family)